MGQLEGKVCLITGASRGIGAAAVQRFAEEGAVVYAAARSIEKIEAMIQEKNLGDNVHPAALNVADPAECKQLLVKIRQEQGRIDVLVNNAGIEKNERIGMISRKNMQEMFETNVFGLIELMQLTARMMQRSGGGSIVNVSSRVGERGGAGQLVYAATKGAVIAATKSAAKELASFGIRVNAISPGLTDTEMFRTVPEEVMKPRLAAICMGRPAKPCEIADAMVYLASDHSSFISGQVINVDGCTII